MQVQVNSVNIDTFKFSVSFDVYNRQIIFDTTPTTYAGASNSGALYVKGISFSLIDQDNVVLTTIDFSNPQLPSPATNKIYTFDATSLNWAFLFQNYTIVGAIQDADNTIYYTPVAYKKICEPVDFNENGYVPGLFQIIPDCRSNILKVKELTPLIYNKETPTSVTKSGTLTYPTGTVSPVTFTNTPFENNVIWSGNYGIACTTIATYDLRDDVYVLVTYLTRNNQFPVSCSDVIGDLACCLTDLQNTAIKNCDNAKGERARQQQLEISPLLMTAFAKDRAGQDVSKEVAAIKKILNCDCGNSILRQNEGDPVNANANTIILQGIGGTTIGTPSINGTTKTFPIISSVYQVVKGNNSDLAWTITRDTSVTNTVKYIITFDYDVMAQYIINSIAASGSLTAQLQDLINTAISIVGLDGKCVIDLTTTSYISTFPVISGDQTSGIIVNGGLGIEAPDGLFIAAGVTTTQNWLNSLGLGVFSVSLNAGTVIVQSIDNPNNIISFQVLGVNNVVRTYSFTATNKSVTQVLQAIINYLCNITALQVALGNTVSLCDYDYNGNVVTTTYGSLVKQSSFNSSLATAICNIISRINAATSVTCITIKNLFVDSPNAVFGSSDRFLSVVGGSCVAASSRQAALAVISAINAYSDVKTAYCAIVCSDPATCPDISDISLAMSGNDIGIYGLTWGFNPVANQLVTVQYKLSSSSVWITATNGLNILPNGNISGTTPYVITGVTAGQTYDVKIVNNCGGVGFQKQITTPTGTVYSANYRLDNFIYNICGQDTVTLYSSQPFGVGVYMFTDIGLTTPVVGYTLIADGTGAIYGIDDIGHVGAYTGSNCTTGTGANFILGNTLYSICGEAQLTLYTNGAFAVGKTLYSDSALTSPVLGYNYVVYKVDNNIYNLNSLSGVIGSATGNLCSSINGLISVVTGLNPVSIGTPNATGIVKAVVGTTVNVRLSMSGDDGAAVLSYNVNGITGTISNSTSPVTLNIVMPAATIPWTLSLSTTSSAESAAISLV